jgi:bacteriorhodopsin
VAFSPDVRLNSRSPVELALLAGLPLVTTLSLMIADEMMIVTGLIAGLSRSTEIARWFFFAISDIFFLYVLYTLVVPGRSAAKLQSSNVQKVFNVTMAITVLIWTGYPIVFGLTAGKGRISPNAEVIVYGILDVVSIR